MTTDEEASPFTPGYETVTLPTETAFRVLESMRMASLLLDPPEDFKPHKWPTAKETAMIVYRDHLRLMMTIEESFGQPPSPAVAEHCARLDEQIKEAGW